MLFLHIEKKINYKKLHIEIKHIIGLTHMLFLHIEIKHIIEITHMLFLHIEIINNYNF